MNAVAQAVEAARACPDCGQTKMAEEFYLFHGKYRDQRCKQCRNKLSLSNKNKKRRAEGHPKMGGGR